MVKAGNGLRQHLLQAMVQNRLSPAQRTEQFAGRLGQGVPSKDRLAQLLQRVQGGNPMVREGQGAAQTIHGYGPNGGVTGTPDNTPQNDPLSNALGANSAQGFTPAPHVPHPGANMPDPNAQAQGGAMRGHSAPPEIQTILDLFNHIDPSHYQAALQHISSLVAQHAQAQNAAPGAPAPGAPAGAPMPGNGYQAPGPARY